MFKLSLKEKKSSYQQENKQLLLDFQLRWTYWTLVRRAMDAKAKPAAPMETASVTACALKDDRKCGRIKKKWLISVIA